MNHPDPQIMIQMTGNNVSSSERDRFGYPIKRLSCTLDAKGWALVQRTIRWAMHNDVVLTFESVKMQVQSQAAE